MNCFYQAIAENNHSVDLIVQGDYFGALEGQTKALSIMKKIMDCDDCDPVYKNNTTFNISLDQCMIQSYACRYVATDICDDNTVPPLHQQQSFLYQHGIIIPTNIGLNEEAGALVSSMIIFNFALACQLAATTTTTEEDIFMNLHRAIKLYQLSFDLQRNAQLDDNVLFSLAVVNNLGLVHRQLHNQEDSGKCFQYVLSTLMFLTDCGEMRHYKYLDGFFLNATELINPHSVAPAA